MEAVDPRPLSPDQWREMFRAINFLFIVVGMAVNGAMCMALAHAVIPSLLLSNEAGPQINGLRRVLYPIFCLSFVIALYALARSMTIAVPILEYMYPRFAI